MRKIHVFIFALAVAAAAIPGCSREDPVGPVEMEEVGKVAIPGNSMGFITSKSMNELSGLSGSVGASVGGAGISGGRLAELVRRKMIGTKSLDWMSMDRPIKALVLDPATFGKPFVMMAPVESRKALLAAIDGAEKKVDDNEIKFSDPEGKVRYLNFVGKNAVFTMDAGAFAASRAFLEGDLLSYPATRALDIQTTSRSAINLVKPLSALGMSNLLKQFPQIGLMTGIAVQKIVDFLDDLGRIRIVASFENGNLVLESSAVPLEGTALARAVAGAKDRRLTLQARAPGDGWLEVATNADPEDTGRFIEGLLNSVVGVVGLSGEVKDVYPKVLKDVTTSMSGESLVWMGWEGEFPGRTLLVTGLSSAEAAKSASTQMTSLILGEFGKKIRLLAPAAGVAAPAPAGSAAPQAAAGAADLSKLDWASLDGLIRSSAGLMASSGVVVDLKKDASDGMEINHMELSIDRARLAAARPEVDKYRNLLGDRLSIGAGFDDANFYAAIGSDSVRDIAAAKKGGQGAARLDKLISEAGFDVTWAMRLSLVDVGRIAASGYEKMVSLLLPGLSSMKDSPEISVVSGARDGRLAFGRVSIPLAGISELRKPPLTRPAP